MVPPTSSILGLEIPLYSSCARPVNFRLYANGSRNLHWLPILNRRAKKCHVEVGTFATVHHESHSNSGTLRAH